MDDLRNSLEMPAGVAGIMSIAKKEMGGLEADRGARSASPSPVPSRVTAKGKNAEPGTDRYAQTRDVS